MHIRHTAPAAALLLVAALPSWTQSASLPTLQRTIELLDGTGKFDHFAIDQDKNRLFIAATGNQSVEVLDLNSGKVTQSVTGFGKPHGLAWVAETKNLYASDGTRADLKIIAGDPLKTVKSIKLSDDADDMVYDAKTHLLYVGHGGSDTANPASIAIVDTQKQQLVKNLPVAAHPEGLEIDNATDRIFANIADASEIAVIDGKRQVQTATWKLSRAKDNVPLAYDSDNQLLFVACRAPGRLVVLDGISGKEINDLPSDSGADDIFYDAELHRIYLIAGSGVVDVYELDSNKSVHSIGVLRTSPGAKTGLFVPAQHALYVGVPSGSGRATSVLVYSTK
jgi:DNA-binding beta-propeller fold protein YncE